MADFLTTSDQQKSNTTRNLLISAVVLVVAAAIAFAVFYHHENHADAEGEVVRVLALPLHTKYAHVADTVGPDPEEDSLYVVTVLRIKDRSYAPLFLKDITGDLRIEDGRLTPAARVRAQDMDRLLAAVPQLQPILAAAGGKPMQPEQTIPPNTTAEGYVIFQYSFAQRLWDTRREASVTVDFYHQDSVRMPVPR